MTAAIRQVIEVVNSQSTAVSSVFGSFPLATLPGSTIVVFANYSHNLSTAAVCSDVLNGQYTLLNSVADTSTAGNTWLTSFAATSAVSIPAGNAITFSLTAADKYVGMIMFEVSGVSSILDHSMLLQSAITGTAVNNLNSGSMAASGSVFILATSYNTTAAGSTPYYPTPGSGYTQGGTWQKITALGNNAVSLWESASISNPGITTATFNSPSAASADNFISAGISFAVAVSVMIPVAWWI